MSKGDPEQRARAALRHVPGLRKQLRALDEPAARGAERGLDLSVGQLREALQERTGPCRVAGVGRTRAGKSTLRFVLTGEAEDGIGRGGQRTTTENVEYRWRDLIMVDTPGVGAFQGTADVRLAGEAAAGADLVLWVVGSDGMQLATVVPVLEMVDRGVPVLVLVNHKETHDLAELSRVREDRMFTDCGARERQIRELLGRADVSVLHGQLDVAGFARRTSNESAWARSRMDHFEKALEEAAVDALARRREVRSMRIARALGGLWRALDEASADFDQTLAEARARMDQLDARRAEVRHSFDEALGRTVSAALVAARGLLGSACELACTEDDRREAERALSAELTSMCAAYVEVVANDAEAAMAAAQKMLGEVAPGSILSAKSMACGQFDVELRGDPATARAYTTARRVVGAGSALLSFTPAGWGLRIALVAAPLALEAVGANLAPSVEGERQDRRKSVEEVCDHADQRLLQLADEGRADALHRFRVAVDTPWAHERASTARRSRRLAPVLTSLHALRKEAA